MKTDSERDLHQHFSTFNALRSTPHSDRANDTHKSYPDLPTRNLPSSPPRESWCLRVLIDEARELPWTGTDVHAQEFFVCASVFHRLTQLEFVSHKTDVLPDKTVSSVIKLSYYAGL